MDYCHLNTKDKNARQNEAEYLENNVMKEALH